MSSSFEKQRQVPKAIERTFIGCSRGSYPSEATALTAIQEGPGRRKWVGIAAIVIAVALWGSVAQAQQPKKVPRIGYLANTESSLSERSEAIQLALRELGYIEGRNIAFEYRSAHGKVDRLPKVAAELARLRVDIIVVLSGVRPLQAARNATKTIPIVMTGRGIDPVEAGLVDSLARPGGNVTGLTNLGGELGGKRLELLKEAAPQITRIAVLYAPVNPSSVLAVKEDLPVAARLLGLTIQPWAARATNDFDRIFAAMGEQHPDGLYMLGGRLMSDNQNRVIGFALKSRLPSIYVYREFVEAGGLMSYGADEADSYRRVAYYVDRILKGAKPADLPVEQPTKFELVVNLKTAKQIGLTIPQNVLSRADRVIR